MPTAHDFCLLCAKSEELTTVIQVLDDSFQRLRGDHITEQVYGVQTPATGAAGVAGRMTILATSCVGMGHLSAAVRTAQIIQSNQPSVLIFVGTAASLKPNEIQIGDVVIPRKAIVRVYEKISEKGQDDYERRAASSEFKELFFDQANALISDISTVDFSPRAASAVARVQSRPISLEVGTIESVSIGAETIQLRPPKILDDIDIFSCGMVVDSVSYRTFITGMADASMRKVGIIDMESYGFLNAIRASEGTGVGTNSVGIMVRGVSDYAGRKQQTEKLPTDWKRTSVRNAALVASKLISALAAV